MWPDHREACGCAWLAADSYTRDEIGTGCWIGQSWEQIARCARHSAVNDEDEWMDAS